MIDGFYIGYMSSKDYGVVLFVFKQNLIVGVDAGGVKFDGEYKQDDVSKRYYGRVKVVAPPNIDLVQGINTGPHGLSYDVDISMPEDFVSMPYIKIETPFGPVNVKLEKLRDIGGIS